MTTSRAAVARNRLHRLVDLLPDASLAPALVALELISDPALLEAIDEAVTLGDPATGGAGDRADHFATAPVDLDHH